MRSSAADLPALRAHVARVLFGMPSAFLFDRQQRATARVADSSIGCDDPGGGDSRDEEVGAQINTRMSFTDVAYADGHEYQVRGKASRTCCFAPGRSALVWMKS